MLPALLLLAFALPDGAAIFRSQCASCHRQGSETRAPLPAAMNTMSRERILLSLDSGSMKEQGAALALPERLAVAAFLTTVNDPANVPPRPCATPMPKLARLAGWQGWSTSPGNTRFADVAIDASKLERKWAFGFAGATSALGQPTVVDGVLFVGSEKGVVYALDAASGCEYWRSKVGKDVRSPVAIADGVAYFSDTGATAYAVNAATGEAVWKAKLDPHPLARSIAAPAIHEGRLYWGVSSAEEVPSGSPKYPCCTFRGSVVALDARDGKQVWKTYVIPQEPKPTRKNSIGTQLYGPSGGGVWLTPTVDGKRQVLYIGTGNAYSEPAGEYTDSVLALDLETGTRKWHRQMTANDVWNMSCFTPGKENCAKDSGPDFDFGAPPMLVRGPDGKERVIAGQKSGMVYALDPDADGKTLWEARAGQGGFLGGIEFGMAADARAIYVPVSDHNGRNPEQGGELVALAIVNGERLWATKRVDPNCAKRPACSAALQAPATAARGVVFAGSMDGHLRAYDSATGTIVWMAATATPVETVNGLTAFGGAINGSGPVIADGWVYVQSGYGALGGMPGNVLLAFGPK
jgi:polyvinyl alcohol dehydrogenase (cytochrome)